MTNIPAIRSPVLVVVDIQREYTTPGRPFYLHGIAESLDNCARILDHARERHWPVLHVQHTQEGPVFSAEHARFVDHFEPLPEESVFTKSQISPYTNPVFKESMLAMKDREVLIMGYGSTTCCLATVISGSLFGLRHSFVGDASWARSPAGDISEAEAHRHAVAIAGIHGRLRTTEEVLQM
jgi:ureidoacrylate peracid hydrolase